MEQTTKRAAGRPKKTTEEAPKSKPAQKGKVYRKEVDQSTLPVVYETVGKKGGVYYKLKNKSLTIFDKEKNEVRAIRYCPSENSIFVDEQSDVAQISQVAFENKVLIVPPSKPNLIAFLEAHPANTKNGGAGFNRLDKTQDVEKQMEDEFAINDAISLIKSRPIEELLPVAMAMRIETNQKDILIKRQLVAMAKKNPREFMSLVDSPMVNARSTVAQAFDFQIVEERNGGVVWFDTGKLIVSVPVGQDRVEIMTRFVMTDKGASVLSEMDKQLELIA